MMVDLPGKPEILVVDADETAIHLRLLREHYRVTVGHSPHAAVEYLRRAPARCEFLVSDVRDNAEDTFRLFRTAKSLVRPPAILVTTADPKLVPDALISGGDSVLLKPYPPNLLFSRLGRLQQERRNANETPNAFSSSTHRHPPGSTRMSLYVHCPQCNASEAVAFDFLSHRRAWYACLACKNVWVAKWTDGLHHATT